MTKITQHKIFEKIKNLDEYLGYLKKLSKETKGKRRLFIADYQLYGLAERYLQLAIQAMIDICQLVIIEEGFEKPEVSQEMISILFSKKILSEKLASRLDGIVGFRNILVHEYGKIDREKVFDYLQNRIDDIADFKKYILKYLKKK
jgi:uncharacterized protein YutE (UPF0331/DUF86 family)